MEVKKYSRRLCRRPLCGYRSSFRKRKKGGSYAGHATNKYLSICHFVLTCLDQIHPRKDGTSYFVANTFVAGRLGHDFRYAIDAWEIKTELKRLKSFLKKP